MHRVLPTGSRDPVRIVCRRGGMSLIELMVVMALIVLMMGIVAPSVGSFGKANMLTLAGNSVSSLLGLARQNALAKNAYTAFVMNNDPASEGYLRSFCVWQLVAPSDGTDPTPANWKPVSKWETLKEGIIAEPPGEADWGTPPFPELPTGMKFGGSTVTKFCQHIFTPAGSLWGTTGPGSIKLVEGHADGGGVEYTRPGSDGPAANTYEITIVPSTGRAKIARK